MRRRTFVALTGWLALALVAHAETYPSRPITMIVPFPAGGATDVLARALSERMRENLGQPIVIENIAGAAGTIAVGRFVRMPADGYTLSIGTSTTHMLTGGLYSLRFDLLNDIDPVIMIGSEPLLIVTRKDFPASNLKELITWLRNNPDKASVGIAGIGAAGHLAGIALQKATGAKFQFVPYRGNGPAMQDLLAGQIDFQIEPASNFQSQVNAGNLKAIAVTSEKRLSSFPNTPTTDEAGLPNFAISLWYGLWVPKGTPTDIVVKLNAIMRETLADPAVEKRLGELGIQPTPAKQQSPEALGKYQRAEAEKWWPIIKAAEIKGQ
jgi:tripartite-type tricarboxylate transporter receptor subunit TctC